MLLSSERTLIRSATVVLAALTCACVPPASRETAPAQSISAAPEGPANSAVIAVSTSPAASVAGAPIVASIGPVSASVGVPIQISTGSALRKVPMEQWPRFRDTLDGKNLEKAAARSIAYLRDLENSRVFFRIGDQTIAPGELEATAEELSKAVAGSKDDEELNRRLREGFDLYESAGSDGQGKVVFSSYYQPVLAASLRRTRKFQYPLYRKPSDLVLVDPAEFGREGGNVLLGRVSNGKIVPYFSRGDIDIRQALAGKRLELAWLADRFDRLDLQIQGSGILKFPNGKLMLAQVAATNGLPYRSVGAALVDAGVVPRAAMSRERLRQYLAEHPEGEDWLIAQNPRYAFFNLSPLRGEPNGTIQQPLTPGRSIAIDPKSIPLGAVAYLEVLMPQADSQGRLLGVFPGSRFALCQDTGGAIQGPGRVDLYVGHGDAAKTSAVNQWSEGRLFILLKKLPPRDR